MIEFSYSTVQALIHEPHTFICKYQLALEPFTTPAREEGSRLHLCWLHASSTVEIATKRQAPT